MAEHGIAGILGLLANAVFGVDYVIGLDGVNTGVSNPTTGTGVGGWPIGNYKQFYIQLAYIVAAVGYSFVMSALLAYLINWIPGLHLRASEEAELLGMDEDQCGEFAYDYVEVRRDYLAWGATNSHEGQEGEEDEGPPRHERYGVQAHSRMLDPDVTEDGVETESDRTKVAQGDRHAVAAEDEKAKEDGER